MKQLHGNSLLLGTAAFIFLAAQPVWADTTQITDVQLSQVDGGINVILKTSSGSRPQVFTTKRGNALVTDIINTQLRLPQGNNFRQDNPASGIASVEIVQLDANSIRVVVTGSNNAPSSQPVGRKDNRITLGFSPSGDTTASKPNPTTPAPIPTTPTPPSNPTAPQTGKKPDVLVPNPEISIDGKPAQPAGPGQPPNQGPPFLPRAVAPPVGDIAISNIDASPVNIDLGTQERVPRLVLRDAPVREVLSLLSRAAGLNLAYVGGAASGGASSGGQTSAAAGGQTISLDIENEPVQDVFNYVLRLSGLEANRSGRTIFVGPKLPNSTRDNVMRNVRLNQVTVGVALNFLVGLGAESAISRERLVTSVSAVPVGNSTAAVTQTQTTTETKLETQRADFKDSNPLLRGLQALGDERTNSVTLIGPARLIDMAMAQLTQLDIRRRQVVVNVKIIDVNLTGTQDYNTSFSFGVGNNFFAVDNGAASLNFGGSRPATASEAATSVNDTPVITNPITGSPFYDPNSTVSISGTTPGTIIVNPDGTTTRSQSAGSGNFYQPISPSNTNPLQPGFSQITPATDNIVTRNADGTSSVTQGTLGTATASLPSLYQFPKRLLASLQAQVTNGNAKILTDPTLIVQEGQQALVNLTQEVVGNITLQTTDTSGGSRTERKIDKQKVGLTLNVKIERIDDNGFVSLSVAPTVSAPTASQNTGNGQIVLVSERSLTSGMIRLRDGQTLILSGIIQDQDRTTVSKIPILGDIPLIGSLFRSTNRSNERREVVVLLTPQIMDDSERSSYGYNYNPSPEVRQMLERRGWQPSGK
ncbi:MULTISPECIES: type IV pilus secretin family protein [unclassified Tolypothrix]|uniref:type IV pilus secretin family protein n=1 Tax=unclassified Tolypothrix TaxID=2649714 RepID=UPI0005EAA9AA|nr:MULTISPECIES: type IV pilus secretin family protein [unclassified Tolypothrix]BAY89115.1 type II and III secretion system protein [Microchaete diplosiphon NIES-3275]EKE96873.1 type II secretory pathway protein [Tolypothrix sp. PCC 7601]MBE9086394.1 AMIN domain-containing protein [Tolypothrix sp. LEGE 11397]UYD29735.1 AMIN domain-containing protein [Tolypothrix sp. PCC 7712]UYD34349.1 AMIN domain-containing protein [Tolypothrix sp. PCC 7601]